MLRLLLLLLLQFSSFDAWIGPNIVHMTQLPWPNPLNIYTYTYIIKHDWKVDGNPLYTYQHN